ncbi:hypothetical protein EGR_10791 [Echinococcus granulosus]|uniref:Uncharacterized protein n=1 Tax=Echinococcus granulosus TaxID=6210 RepID=W6U019_ECHGR|nr:hypothetical protein EGR_10791 [Echinococcus granulosus]EUB54353.1 hypothetical protein EGR_10791 [Echinococcus granulosus]
MNLLRIFAVVITCLIVVGFGYPTHPTIPSYQTAVWHSSANTGYRCRAGICGYRCSSPWCHGFESALYPQMAMQEMWGSGAHGRHAHSRTMTEFLMKASPEDLTMLIESTPNIDEPHLDTAVVTPPSNETCIPRWYTHRTNNSDTCGCAARKSEFKYEARTDERLEKAPVTTRQYRFEGICSLSSPLPRRNLTMHSPSEVYPPNTSHIRGTSI